MKILLVRLRLIGDVVLTTPLLGALKRRFPDASLSYLVEPLAAEVVRDNPYLDQIIVAPKPRGLRRWRADLGLARRLRRDRYDVALDLHGGPRAAWLTWATRAPMRIGYRSVGRAWMYTHVVERPDDLSPRHSVRKQWDLLAPLGVEAADPVRHPVAIPSSRQAVERLDAHLRGLGVEPGRHQLVVMHVSAGNPFRRWPEASFGELVRRLLAGRPDRRVLLTAGPSDAAAAGRIASSARQGLGPGDGMAAEAAVDLPELRVLVERAAVYIGGDSGPLHLAGATTTPIVALFGPTLPERSMPWRDPRWFAEAVDAGPLPCRPCRQRVCEPGDFRCLTRITPEQVLAAAERALRA